MANLIARAPNWKGTTSLGGSEHPRRSVYAVTTKLEALQGTAVQPKKLLGWLLEAASRGELVFVLDDGSGAGLIATTTPNDLAWLQALVAGPWTRMTLPKSGAAFPPPPGGYGGLGSSEGTPGAVDYPNPDLPTGGYDFPPNGDGPNAGAPPPNVPDGPDPGANDRGAFGPGGPNTAVPWREESWDFSGGTYKIASGDTLQGVGLAYLDDGSLTALRTISALNQGTPGWHSLDSVDVGTPIRMPQKAIDRARRMAAKAAGTAAGNTAKNAGLAVIQAISSPVGMVVASVAGVAVIGGTIYLFMRKPTRANPRRRRRARA